MEKISKSELDFIRQSISVGLRVDERDFLTHRDIKFLENDYPKCDKSLLITRGATSIEVNIQFKSILETLEHMNYITEDYHPGNIIDLDEPSISVTFNHLDGTEYENIEFFNEPPIFSFLKDFLEEHKIGLNIETIIMSDDGNVYDLLFHGLSHIFSSISIPNVDNLEKDIHISIEVPTCMTYAIFDQKIIVDPNYLEETSSDALIRIYHLNHNPIAISTHKSINFEIYERIVQECIKYL